MLDLLLTVIVFAQDSGTGSGGGGTESSSGDSSAVFIIVATVVALLVIGVALLLVRARGTDQSRSPRRSHTTEPVGGTASSGKPMHVDPDPDHLAGGRSRFTDPLGKGQGKDEG